MSSNKKGRWRNLNQSLRDWYGCERGDLEMTHYQPQPHQVGKTVEKLMGNFVSEDLAVLIKIKNNWDRIVGDNVKRFAVPYCLEDGVLVVEVCHPAWLRELNGSFKQVILQKIQDSFGVDLCREISFIPGGRASSARKDREK